MQLPELSLEPPPRSQAQRPAPVDGADGVGEPADALRSLATRPLIDRVRDELLRSISGGLFPDARLPGEEELAARLGVSRTTLRAALRSLEEDGLLTRQRGRPTRINNHVVKGLSLSRVAGFYDLIRESGYQPTIASTLVRETTAPDHVAERLNAQPGLPIVSIDRLFMADERQAIFVREMIAADHLPRRVPPEAVPSSIFEFADQFCDWNVDHTIVEIMSGVADNGAAEVLGLRAGDPFLRLVETHYSIEGIPFIVSDIAVIDKLIRFIVVRRHY